MKSYEMFGPAGDRACQAMVDTISKEINSAKKITPKDLFLMAKRGIEKISTRFEEVEDTEPMFHISQEINKALEANGYSFRLDRHLNIH